MDVIEFDRPIYDQYQEVPNLFTDVGEAQPVRFAVDLEKRELAEKRCLDYRLAPDFPSIDPRQGGKRYRDFWMLGISATGRSGRKFFDQLVHADWSAAQTSDIYQAPPMHYLGGEPVFIGDESRPETGVVICQVFDARRAASAFVIFDAFHVARGPVATLRLEAPIPLAFHAAFGHHAEK